MFLQLLSVRMRCAISGYSLTQYLLVTLSLTLSLLSEHPLHTQHIKHAKGGTQTTLGHRHKLWS